MPSLVPKIIYFRQLSVARCAERLETIFGPIYWITEVVFEMVRTVPSEAKDELRFVTQNYIFDVLFHSVISKFVPLIEETYHFPYFHMARVVRTGVFDAWGITCTLECSSLGWVYAPSHHCALEKGLPEVHTKNAGDEVMSIAVMKPGGAHNRGSFLASKHVGGNPPALDSPLLRGDHLSYTTNRSACTKVAGGNPPAFGSPLCVEDHLSYTTAEDLMGGPRRSQELLTNFSQVVSREIPLVSKESMISRIIDMPFIAKRCKLDSAHVICDLGKVVVARQGLSIDGGALGQTCAYRSMYRVGNYPLPVVVVHLYPVIPLKEGKVLLEESNEILFDRLSKGVYAGMRALPIAQREVAEGHLLNQDVESNQIAFARFNVEVFVLLVFAKDRGEMESLFWKASVAQCLPVFKDAFGDVRRLVVKYEGDQIVLGAVADVARFINEDRKLSHQAVPSIIKMPRDTPRLRDSPPCVESHLSYTTSRSAESIVCEPEHKFVTIDANTCSTYRRAA